MRMLSPSGGQLLCELPHPRRDGSTHLLLDPRGRPPDPPLLHEAVDAVHAAPPRRATISTPEVRKPRAARARSKAVKRARKGRLDSGSKARASRGKGRRP